MNEPTPEEAAAALRTVHEGKEQVITSAVGSRWIWIVSGLAVFLYSLANDLFPAAGPWLTWLLLAFLLVAVVGLRTRVGSTLTRRPVIVSGRSLPLPVKWRLLRIAPVLGLGIAVAMVVSLLHLPHGGIYYGALAGIYIMFLSPRLQLWLLRRQDRD
ncbi:hypothetical protein ACLQ28_23250 [Micromonospora sp. DT201]|uniref:hypothetical protein n=1 Tax=Micromonospora sp. DT201 TaxID=3393442 RepID=UPI003CFB8BCB